MAEDVPVVFEGVRMAFGDREVFHDLSLAVPRGRITVILGGSGTGKSTILRLVGGLVQPKAGRILVNGRDITRLPARAMFVVRRRLGMMFQGGALLDSLTVFDNLAIPLREHRALPEPAIAARVHERLEAVGLFGVDDLLPGQLSGGMVKRVALARALMGEPEILLCDEPFSGLDPVSVKTIEALLVQVNRRFGITIVVVSHHIASTMRIADHVILLLPGFSVAGTPAELAAHPDRRVAAFLDEYPDPLARSETGPGAHP